MNRLWKRSTWEGSKGLFSKGSTLKHVFFLPKLLGVVLFAWVLIGGISEAEASHFRGGTLTYKWISGRTVEFTLETYWRIGSLGSNACASGAAAGTCVGRNYGNFSINTGAGSVNIPQKVNFNDTISFSMIGTVRYTYPRDGKFTAVWSGCCWISGASGPAGNNWNLNVVVELPKINNSPVFNSPTFFQACRNFKFTTNVNVSDPDRDSFTLRLAHRQNSGIALNTSTGEVTFTPTTTGNFVFTVVATDSKGSVAYRDFMINVLATCNNKGPKITLNPAAITVAGGQQACTNITVTDPDAGNKFFITARPTKTPVTLTPTTALTAGRPNPYTFKYCWTPAKADEGTTHNIQFNALDDGLPPLFAQGTFSVTVLDGKPPVIATNPTTLQVDEGKTLVFTVTASDPDNNGIDTFTQTGLPTFCTSKKDSATKYTITCNPGFSDGPKTYSTLKFTAKDKDGKPKTVTQTVNIKVNDVNRPPTSKGPGDQTLDEDKAAKFGVTSSDPDGDTLTHTMSGLPAEAKIDPTTGEITWTPKQKDVGSYNVTVAVTDGKGGKVEVKFKVTVNNVNDPPVISGTPGDEATEDVEYTYSPTVTDEDPGDAGKLTWKFKKNPTGAKIDPATGKVTWTPGDADVGKDAEFEIEVCDPQGACVTQSWKVKTKNVNDPPTIDTKPPTEAFVGVEMNYKPKASDPDPNEKQTWKLTKGPSNATIDPATGELKWTPDPADAGKEVDFEIEVCDDNGACTKQSWKVKVKVLCKVDTDCPDPQICSPDNGNYVCMDPGCANQNPKCATQGEICNGSQCGANPCDGKTCAQGEYCRPSDGKCIKPCAGVTCQAGEYCLDGACVKDPCAANPCKADEYCDASDPQNPTCKSNPCSTNQACRHGRVCTPKAPYCMMDPCGLLTCPDPAAQRCLAGQCVDRLPCFVDVDCPGDQVCIGRLCYPSGCYDQNNACQNPQLCLKAKCEDPACATKQCATGEFCRNSDATCAKPCSGVKCQAGEMCKDGACVADPCANANCAAGEVCVKGTCEPDKCSASNVCKAGRVCYPMDNGCIDDPCAGVTCPDSKQVCKWGQCQAPDSCKFDKDCPGELLCLSGKCVKPTCKENADCQNGEVCSEGTCKPDPCANKQCADGEYCRAGQCVPSCAGVFCPEKQVCVDGKCTADPCADKQCAAGEVCVNGNCVKDECEQDSCKGKRVCRADKCVEPPCGNVTCPTGQTCNNGQCTGDLPCTYDSDCPGTAICVNKVCKPAGCYENACEGDKICSNGACVDNPCKGKTCADGEFCRPTDGTCVKLCPTCPEGKVCVDGACQDDPCKDKTCPDGEVCTNGNCTADPCAGKTDACKSQRVCSADGCGDDSCKGVECPTDHTCRKGVCVGPPLPGPEPGPEPSPEPVQDSGVQDLNGYEVGGGCVCSQGSVSFSLAGLWLGLIGLLCLFRLRRRYQK
ncbi:MAG: hypothetical protein EP343_30650 [Deltaproteobacteria bacterium]|nr:MAG: hypothetical protein EP343_30650 [Deltaproteobacteria bacterium]